MSSSPGWEALTRSTSSLWFGPHFLMKQELSSVIWPAVNFLRLFSFFPSITVLGNRAGFDTCQCEKVRQREKWEWGCLRIASVMTVRLNFGNFWALEKLRLSLRIREQSSVQCQCVWHSTQREVSRDRQIAIGRKKRGKWECQSLRDPSHETEND